MQPLDCAPCRIADTLTVDVWRDKQHVQIAMLTIFFKVVVPAPELLQDAVVERFPVVFDKLLPDAYDGSGRVCLFLHRVCSDLVSLLYRRKCCHRTDDRSAVL